MAALRERFADMDLEFSIGGQISFDVFPRVCACPGSRGSCWASSNRGASPGRQVSDPPPPHAGAGLGQDLLPAVCETGL